MRIISGAVSGVSHLAGLQVELSKQARQRLKWFDYYNSRSHNARLNEYTDLTTGILMAII